MAGIASNLQPGSAGYQRKNTRFYIQGKMRASPSPRLLRLLAVVTYHCRRNSQQHKMYFRKATKADIPEIVDKLGSIREDFRIPLPEIFY